LFARRIFSPPTQIITGEVMNRPIAMLLVVLIMAGLLFSIFALFQGKFVEALSIYPLLIVAYVFSARQKKGK